MTVLVHRIVSSQVVPLDLIFGLQRPDFTLRRPQVARHTPLTYDYLFVVRSKRALRAIAAAKFQTTSSAAPETDGFGDGGGPCR
jgi:hypothetical protein